jgi:hypothetical protein
LRILLPLLNGLAGKGRSNLGRGNPQLCGAADDNMPALVVDGDLVVANQGWAIAEYARDQSPVLVVGELFFRSAGQGCGGGDRLVGERLPVMCGGHHAERHNHADQQSKSQAEKRGEDTSGHGGGYSIDASR